VWAAPSRSGNVAGWRGRLGSILPAGAGGGSGRRAEAGGTPASLPACRSALASTSSAPHSWVNGKVTAAKPIPDDAAPQERTVDHHALGTKPALGAGQNRGCWPDRGGDATENWLIEGAKKGSEAGALAWRYGDADCQ